MFGEIVGTVAGAFLSNRARKDAKAASKQQFELAKQELELQREIAEDQKELADRQMAFQQTSFDYLVEENARRAEIERLNRIIQAEQRQYLIDEAERDRIFLEEDRQAQIERQIAEDKEAARIQAFQLQNILRNQQLAQEERDFVQQQLERAQAIAEGERDQDLRFFLQNQAKAEIERDFLISQFEGARDQYNRERALDLAQRNEIAGSIYDLQGALRQAQGELGPMAELPSLTPEMIDEEIGRRSAQYQQDVDRAAQAVASVGEADLIRRGMDTGTAATQKRGDIAARLADQYQDARDRAYDDALKYISGRTDSLATNVNARNAQRGQILGELRDVYSAGLPEMLRLPQVRSGTGAYNLLGNIKSGIYDRNLVSGVGPTNMRLPTAQTSDYRNLGSGMARYGTRLSPSIFRNLAGIESAVMSPYQMNDLSAPASYGNIAGGVFGDMLEGSGNRFNAYNAAGVAAAGQAGRAMSDLLNYGQSAGQLFDKAFPDFFSFGSGGGTSIAQNYNPGLYPGQDFSGAV